MNQEQYDAEIERQIYEQRENGPEPTPEELLVILNKARAEMKEMGL